MCRSRMCLGIRGFIAAGVLALVAGQPAPADAQMYNTPPTPVQPRDVNAHEAQSEDSQFEDRQVGNALPDVVRYEEAAPKYTQTKNVQAGAPSFGECESAVDDSALRAEVFDGARAAMRKAALDVSYGEIVRRSWVAARFDAKFEQIVDSKIAILRKDRAYLERLLDGNVPSRAEEMATRTANLVFDSPEFDALSKDLQREIGERLEPLIADADLETQNRAADCVRIYLGARYANSLRQAFSSEIGEISPRGGVDADDVGVAAGFSLAGIVAAMLTVVFRRLVRRIVRAVTRRLAGAIAARLAAWASVVVGVAVLIYELIAGAEGVFPVIRDELLSNETKQLIQTGIIEELAASSPEELDRRAQEIAGQMFERWRDFKENHRVVLALADSEPEFRDFLQDQPPQRFETLSVIVRALRGAEGDDAAVMSALRSGALNEALRVPSIAEDLEYWGPRGLTLDDLAAWRTTAGPYYEKALSFGLPGVLRPGELSQDELAVILDLGGGEAARHVAEMPPGRRSEALKFSADMLRPLALRLEADQLSAVFATLEPVVNLETRALYLQQAAQDPSVAAIFVRAGAANAVSGSRSPEIALAVLADEASLWSPFALVEHIGHVADGTVSPFVLTARYGWGLAATGGVALLIVIWFLRGLLGMLGLQRRRSTS